MTDAELWDLLVGALAPAVIAGVLRPGWSKRTRALVAFGVCAAIGAGTAWFAGNLTGRSLVSSVLVVLVTALATYRGLWKPTGAAGAIEAATSPRAG